jgi:ABC-type uncharacterized transport system permease subunit
VQFEPREHVSAWSAALAPVFAVAVALALCSVLIIWTGVPVLEAYGLLLKGAFGSKFAISETLTRATPLMLTGLAAAVAFRAKFWNIGAEGQLYCGALAVTWLGTGVVQLPPILMIPLLCLAGALAGGAALIIPVVLKNRLKVDEVVTTLLLNFIIVLFVSYLLEGPWKDPMSMGWPQGAPIIDEGVLPKLIAKTRLHLGLVLAVAAAIVVWLVMNFTVWGYEIRAVGHNATAAAFAGISVNKTIIRTALLSGGLAGLAGVTEVTGLKGYLTLDLSPGFGYAGIAVAMLAQLHPIGVIVSALFLSAIFVGAGFMSRAVEIPTYIADVLVATSLLMVLLSVMLVRFRLRRG